MIFVLLLHILRAANFTMAISYDFTNLFSLGLFIQLIVAKWLERGVPIYNILHFWILSSLTFIKVTKEKTNARLIASVVPLIRIGLDLARVEIYVTFQLDLGKKYLLSKTFIYIYIVVGRGRNGLIEFDMYPFDFQNNDTQPFHSPSAYPHTLSIVLVFFLGNWRRALIPKCARKVLICHSLFSFILSVHIELYVFISFHILRFTRLK